MTSDFEESRPRSSLVPAVLPGRAQPALDRRPVALRQVIEDVRSLWSQPVPSGADDLGMPGSVPIETDKLSAVPEAAGDSLEPCDHDGTATGRLRLDAARGALIMEVACERCGDVLIRLGTAPYAALPQLEGLLSAAA